MKGIQFSIGVQGWFANQPHTGIGQHTLGLVRALAKQKNIQCGLIVPEPVKIKGIPSAWIKVVRPKKIWPKSLQKAYWERVQAPQALANLALDWEYYPYPCPLPRQAPHLRAMTVHDTILWEDKRYHSPLKKQYLELTKHALVDVDHLFSVSQSTKDSLGIPAASILPNAIEWPEGVLPKKPYQNALIYVGGYDLRKRVPELVESFSALRKKHPELELLLVGKPHHVSKYYPPVPQAPGVKFLGALSPKDLAASLKSAWVFIHFSDSEGFNLPLLEAMTAGIPAIVRDLPVNREISQNTALFIDPSSFRSLSATIKTLKDSKKRAEVIARQKKVARQYSWEKTAKIFIKALAR